jgi:hypothetical protein
MNRSRSAFEFDLNSNRFTNDKTYGNKKGFLFLSMAVGQNPPIPGTSPAGLPLLPPACGLASGPVSHRLAQWGPAKLASLIGVSGLGEFVPNSYYTRSSSPFLINPNRIVFESN